LYYITREKPESGQAGRFRDTVKILCTLPPLHPLLKCVACPLCLSIKSTSQKWMWCASVLNPQIVDQECMYNYIY